MTRLNVTQARTVKILIDDRKELAMVFVQGRRGIRKYELNGADVNQLMLDCYDEGMKRSDSVGLTQSTTTFRRENAE